MILNCEREAELLAFLFQQLPRSAKTRLRKTLKGRGVAVNGRPVTQFDFQLRPGDQVEVSRTGKAAVSALHRFGIRKVYEDETLILIEKPAGLLTVGTARVPQRTAIFAVNAYLNTLAGPRGRIRRKQVFVVHRLDRDASGLVLFAKNERTKLALQSNWHDVRKEYVGIVESCPAQAEATLENYLAENARLRVVSGPRRPGAKKAVTHYQVTEQSRGRALLRIQIETGRKHQIRVQLADCGHPIVGDKDYGAKPVTLKRLALHACFLKFKHPETGEGLQFSSPLPPELQALLGGS